MTTGYREFLGADGRRGPAPAAPSTEDTARQRSLLQQRNSRLKLTLRVLVLVLGIGLVTLFHFFSLAALGTLLMEDSAKLLARSVVLNRQLLLQAPASSRPGIALDLSAPNHRVLPANQATPGTAIEHGRPIAYDIVARLRGELGDRFDVSLRQASAGGSTEMVVIAFDVEGERWQVEYTPTSPAIDAWVGVVAWLSLLGVIALGTLLYIGRRIDRPLQLIARQLEASPGTLSPVQVPDHALGEVREVVRAFNTLVEANQRQAHSKQQLLAGVSHDLRTPLARLRMRIELNCQEALAAELNADIAVLERIVSQFLGYAQGEMHIGFGSPWSVAEVASNVVESYQQRGFPVTFRTSGVDWKAPDLATQRVLVNLIDNAFAYGAPPVEVTLHSRQGHGRQQVWLIVWDHGLGMTPEEFDIARQPFQRLRHEVSDGEHCGLGLAIVGQIADFTGAQLRTFQDRVGRCGVGLVWRVVHAPGPVAADADDGPWPSRYPSQFE